ncbi:YbaK/EbsC family protein [Allorhizocola rhizosphaerae]|uniref:YbaK/EbsC family protein n=1 Tax=Allorhizocola rhizosphaerae TaxID=1872709 RepID=UPI000E3B72FB|nr:YbaK/EbsC family protein [Allorhizocola rhizosphaerae]
MSEANTIQRETPHNQHPNVTAVQQRLDEAGIDSRIVLLDEGVHTAAAAAQALGVQVGQIANSLIFQIGDDEPLLILTSGAHRVDTAKVAAELGVPKLKRATPEFVREHTGQVIGGVAPVGHPKPVRTLLDRDLAQYDVIWAAGGIPQAVFPIGYAQLRAITGATEVDVA